MKSFLLIFISCASLVSCSNFNNTVKNQIKYAKYAKMSVADNEFMSTTIERYSHSNDTEISIEKFYLIYDFNKKNPSFTYINSDSTRYMRFDNKKYCLVDHNNREIASIKKSKEEGAYWIMKNTIESIFRGMPYYFQLLGKNFLFSNILIHNNIIDTTIEDIDPIVFTSTTPISYIYNRETKEYDIPLQYNIITYINSRTYHIDSIVSENITDNVFMEKTTLINSEISFENKQTFIDSIFDFNDTKYSCYSYHDENNLPYSMRASSNRNINDSILNFPIVSLNKDTTYLKDKTSWTLLNLWNLNCPPCIENLNNYKQEKDSIGYRILENEGIEIMAVNYDSDNMGLLKNIADKTASTDIIYSAKGLGGYISIPYLGYYYLISPDKKIVYKNLDLGDYSELLKAKEEYEKRPRSKD